MSTAKYIGHVGALAEALGIGNVRRNATRVTVSIGAAVVVVMATVVPAPVSTVSPAAQLSADSTALMMGGSGIPTWNDADVEVIMGQFIAPTHPTAPGEIITPVAVTTPSELWPGGRWAGPLVCLALCPASVFGPGGSGWLPDEPTPLWKLSGVFDLTFDQSVQAGVADLETAMAEHGNDDLVIYGYSQGAVIANLEKRKLAQQYPGPEAPDIDFVLGGDPNLPNGGLFARFPGLYIPILDFSFNGPAPTDTQFSTTVITQQYDFFADFPLYPLNFIADVNALLGFFYVHLYPFDVSLADASTPSPDTHGNTDYYFFETRDLPLFGPLRTLGIPEAFIDMVEPFFRVLVELGYDRTIPPWEPTPARLIPTLDPVTLVADLADAIGEGINNAAALVGSPPLLSIPAPVTLAAPGIETATADVSPQVMSIETPTQTEQVMSTGASTDLAPSTTKVNETVSADVSQQVTATEVVSEMGQVTSAKKAVQTAEPNDASAELTAASAPERSASASTPKPATPRRVVRGSPESGEQQQDLPHGVDGDQPTTGSSHGAATAGSGTDSSDSDAGES